VVNPLDYDHVVVAFSGGKDSSAAFLHLLECNVPKSRIELWHHDIDGREGSHLMDWPSTPAYCAAFARAFDVPLYFSWRSGGFEREMLRDRTSTAPVHWENPGGSLGQAGGKGPPGTRLKFPQVSSNLSVRWCSAYLKIDVAVIALRNQPRFREKKTLFISGERAEESPCRARYKEFEADRTHSNKRTVHRWRPIHSWREQQVWEIIRGHRVNPHPAYRLGWTRLSCRACIFGLPNQWASLRAMDPVGFSVLSEYERRFGVTIRRNKSIEEMATNGKPFVGCENHQLVEEAMSPNWNHPIILPEGSWQLPPGAFTGNGGPT
jgi:3'-phosphoadenosine 5'-phosphosulfate sulfotransferase (PAPS reductase)/FAD synthetase